jgi:hypothetical protein
VGKLPAAAAKAVFSGQFNAANTGGFNLPATELKKGLRRANRRTAGTPLTSTPHLGIFAKSIRNVPVCRPCLIALPTLRLNRLPRGTGRSLSLRRCFLPPA